jgi:hypothetical protein
MRYTFEKTAVGHYKLVLRFKRLTLTLEFPP